MDRGTHQRLAGKLPAIGRALRPLAHDLWRVLSHRLLHDRLTEGCAIASRHLPLARAFRRPARTRSAIKLRSSSATAPSTVKIIFPVGVVVSTCSDSETNSIPRERKVSSARSK